MDIISKIILQAQGGDQAAREVGKVTKAYQEAGQAAKGINPESTVSSDPFARATGGGAPRSYSREGNDDYRDRMRRREREHFERTSGGGRGGVGGLLTGGINAVTTGATGDVSSGIASGLGALGALGKLGIVGVIAGATVGAVSKLADKDLDLRSQIWSGSGIGQRLSQRNYDEFRASVRGLLAGEGAGYSDMALPLLQAMSESGTANFDQKDVLGMLAISQNTGVNVGSLGKLYGRLQSAGAGGKLVTNPYFANAAEQGFGRGRMTEFVDTVTSAIEGAMTRGFEKGSSIFGNSYTLFAQSLADLGRFGGVAPEAAKGIFGKVQAGIAASDRGITSPEEAMQFLAARKPGESYFETLKRMTSPESEMQRYENLKMWAGGDKDKLIQMVMSQYGMGVREAEAYIRTKDKRIFANQMIEAGGGAAGTGTIPIYTQAPEEDETLRRQRAKERRKTLGEGITNAVGGFMADVTEILTGKPLSSQALEAQGLFQKISPGKGGFGKAQSSFGNLFIGQKSDFLKYIPDNLKDFVTGAMENDEVSKLNNPIFTQMIPMLGLYGGWKSGGISVTKDEEAMLKKYEAVFQAVGKVDLGKEDASTEALGELLKQLGRADEQNLDGVKNLYSILEVLTAIKSYLEGGTVTPTGGVQ